MMPLETVPFMLPFLAFDLGNVLLPFDHMKACAAIGDKYGIKASAVYGRIFESGLARKFELGLFSPSEFTTHCSQALETNIRENDLQFLWSDIFVQDKDMEALVRRLVPIADLCLVSNTNLWHFTWIEQRFRVVSHFSTRVLSYEIGVMKPDAAVYSAVLRHVKPNQKCFFIDDILENTMASTVAGFTGIRFKCHSDLLLELRRLGIID